MYLLMYTVNYFVKMLILDSWYNKFHCNIEIQANRSRIRTKEESIGNKKHRFRKDDSGEGLVRVQCVLFTMNVFYLFNVIH